MREIVLDTETTGLDPLRGDRLVEVGCIEIYNRMPTGQTFHRYINPERDMPAEMDLLGPADGRHPAGSQRSQDPVRTDPQTGLEAAIPAG